MTQIQLRIKRLKLIIKTKYELWRFDRRHPEYKKGLPPNDTDR